MLIPKLVSYNSNAFKSCQNNYKQQNFSGNLIYKGFEEASWSNAGGMGEFYYKRYTYIPSDNETEEEISKEVTRLGRKAAKKLPDNSLACKFCVLIDVKAKGKENYTQKIFDK